MGRPLFVQFVESQLAQGIETSFFVDEFRWVRLLVYTCAVCFQLVAYCLWFGIRSYDHVNMICAGRNSEYVPSPVFTVLATCLLDCLAIVWLQQGCFAFHFFSAPFGEQGLRQLLSTQSFSPTT